MKRIVLIIGFMLAAVAAHATVTSQTISVTYTCTGSVGPYAFVFAASAPAALQVTENGTVLASTAYTVTAVNNNLDNGGSVTLNAPCASGTLVLTRVTPLTQTSVFTDNMPVPMKTFENGLDKLTEIDQELYEGKAGIGSCPSGQFETADTISGPTCVLPPYPNLTSPLPIVSGGTGATTATGAMQNLNIPTPFGAQAYLIGPTIYDGFNFADSTPPLSWTNQIAASGNSQWQVTGNGAQVVGQHLVPVSGPPAGNFYAWLPNTSTVGGTAQPITTMGGTFRMCPNNDGNPYNPGQTAITMIASNITNDLGHGFMHLEIRPIGWALNDTLTNTGGFITVGQGQTNIKPDCTTEYAVEMDLNVAAGTVKVILPGGQVANIADSKITTINPVIGGWQASDKGDGSADAGWGSVWMGGPSQAKKYSATAGHSADIQALQGVQNTFQYVYPDGIGPTFTLSGAAGLYRISAGRAISTYIIDETVNLTANIVTSVEQTLSFKAISRNGPGTMQGWQNSDEGSALIDYAIVSNDGGGNLALDIHKNTASDVVVSMLGTGTFTPATTYTVGATPYANSYVINFVTNPPPIFQITLPAGPGWVTALSQDPTTSNQQLTGRFIMTASGTPGASAIEDLDLEVSGYSNGTATCIIPRAEGAEFGGAPTSPITRVRCTTNGAGSLIHLDLYNATAAPVTLTATNGTQTGAWTLNPTPAINALPLADGGPDVAFQLPGSGGGTVSAGTAQQFAYYAANGSTVSGNPNFHINNNVSVGKSALADLNTLSLSVAVGTYALQDDATGDNDTAVGVGALRFATNNKNSAFGAVALEGITTGTEDIGFGYGAGLDTGSWINETSSYSTYLGTFTRPAADGDIYEIVIGDTVTGNGSHTTTIGDSANTATYTGGISMPLLIFSHAGTQLAACASTTIGTAWVSDAVALTPGTAYSPSAGAGTDTIQVQCTYTGSAYAWQTM